MVFTCLIFDTRPLQYSQICDASGICNTLFPHNVSDHEDLFIFNYFGLKSAAQLLLEDERWNTRVKDVPK